MKALSDVGKRLQNPPPEPYGLSPEPEVQGGGLCYLKGATSRAAQL